jgi:hypothetical protein
VPALQSIRHEKFAELIAGGMPAAQAYREVTGRIANSDVQSVKMRKRAGVERRIKELKEQNSQRAQMTREELLAFYTEVIRTPADQVPPGSPVIQAYEETLEGGRKIRIVDKAAAGVALAKMTGWNEPERVELAASNSLTRYLAELRQQKLGDGMFTVAGRDRLVIELEPAVPLKNENGGAPRSDAAGE